MSGVSTALPSILQSAGSDPLLNGLIGWWKFDEGSGNTASDSSPGGNNATGTGSPTWSTGKIGPYCATFNGSNYFVSPQVGTLSAYPFTLAAWIINSAGGTNVANSYADDGSNVIYYAIGLNSNYPYLAVRSSVADENSVTDTSVGPFVGVWTHVACVFVSATQRDYYVNGSYLFTDTVSIPFVAANTIGLGVANRNSQFGFVTGSVDDARLYNRALSSSDITLLYN